jgi:hypothetical protein
MVLFEMLFQVDLLSEWSLALLAAVLLDWVVYQLVLAQIACICEGLFTEIADIILLLSV